MSKEGTSKLVAGGRRALVTLGLKRRPTRVPLVAAIAGLALAVGAVFALPRVRKAWARRTLRAQPPSAGASPAAPRPSGEASLGIGTGGNGVHAEAETDALGRAENEGMHPGRW
jgi:hypothetical protein